MDNEKMKEKEVFNIEELKKYYSEFMIDYKSKCLKLLSTLEIEELIKNF